jgi:hypothetical protein
LELSLELLESETEDRPEDSDGVGEGSSFTETGGELRFWKTTI